MRVSSEPFTALQRAPVAASLDLPCMHWRSRVDFVRAESAAYRPKPLSVANVAAAVAVSDMTRTQGRLAYTS